MTHVVATLYEKLGGASAIEAVVGEFYKRVLADDELRGFFAKTDMNVQVQQQTKFLSMALGGPNEYKGRSMSAAHNGMGITEHHFELVAGHLVAALKSAGVGQSEVDAVLALVGPLKPEIVMA